MPRPRFARIAFRIGEPIIPFPFFFLHSRKGGISHISTIFFTSFPMRYRWRTKGNKVVSPSRIIRYYYIVDIHRNSKKNIHGFFFNSFAKMRKNRSTNYRATFSSKARTRRNEDILERTRKRSVNRRVAMYLQTRHGCPAHANGPFDRFSSKFTYRWLSGPTIFVILVRRKRSHVRREGAVTWRGAQRP